MKRTLLILAVLTVNVLVMALAGCSGGEEAANAPSKAEIDKGLEGQPKVDPNLGEPMKPGAKGGP